LPVAPIVNNVSTSFIEKVAKLPVTALDRDEDKVPTEQVEEFPAMDMEIEKPTVPTFTVANVPFSWIDLLVSSVPVAEVDEFPEIDIFVLP
jgi:hypothetical protein